MQKKRSPRVVVTFLASLAAGVVMLFSGCATVSDETCCVSDVCPVHHVKMEKETIDVYWGSLMDRYWMRYQKASLEKFPFCENETTYGGGTQPPFDKKKVFVCDQCVTAFKQWEKSMTVDGRNGVADVCPVHSVRMTKHDQHIVYGKVNEAKFLAYRKIYDAQFPFAEMWFYGGDAEEWNSPLWLATWHCEQCDSAAKKWFQENGSDTLPFPRTPPSLAQVQSIQDIAARFPTPPSAVQKN